MSKKLSTSITVVIALAASVILMGCQPAATETPPPTAAATVEAAPSATMLPPTETGTPPASTATSAPVSTSTMVPTADVPVTDTADTGTEAADAAPQTTPPTAEPITPSPTPTLLPTTGSGAVTYTFEELVTDPIDMNSPATVTTINFNESYRWAINAGQSRINLVYDAYRQGTSTETTAQLPTGTLNVYVDGYLAASVNPAIGSNQVLSVPIPPQAVEDTDDNGHSVRLYYFDRELCEIGGRSGITIHEASNITLQYDILPTNVDLAQFPRPLFQENTPGEAVLIIIPEDYSINDAQAALGVAATLGRDSFGDVQAYLRTTSTVTEAELGLYSAILIGQPGSNAIINSLYQGSSMPTLRQLDGTITTLAGTPISPEVGIVQEILSPRNSARVWVIATGQTDESVLRASRALSSPTPSFGFSGNLALIEDVIDMPDAEQGSSLVQDSQVTLADLGFTSTTIEGIGNRSILVSFFVPANWAIQDAAFVLNYISSAALAGGASGITVELNGEPIGSVQLGDEESNENSVVFGLPNEDIYPGEINSMRINTSLQLEEECTTPESDLAWVRIRENSTLRIDREERTFAGQGTINDPLGALLSQPDLSDLAIVLPAAATPTELQAAAHVVWLLGDRSLGDAFDPQVYLGDVQTSDLIGSNVIAIGLPSNNALYPMLDDNLFQPFDLESNRMIQQVGNLVYELPDNFSLGVIQSIVAPWDASRAITLVGGTNEEGLQWAMEAITNEDLRFQINRNLTFIRNDSIESIDASTSAQGVVVASVEEVIGDEGDLTSNAVTPSPTRVADVETAGSVETGNTGAQPAAFAPDANGLSPVVLIASLALVLVGAGLGLFGYRRSRRNEKPQGDE